jgi:hypothetical protein
MNYNPPTTTTFFILFNSTSNFNLIKKKITNA